MQFMAHLWIEQEQDWGILPLGTDHHLTLTESPAQPVRVGTGRDIGTAVATIQPVVARGSEWVLLCRPGSCRVNGESVALGIRTLRDKDEIRPANGQRLFFSTETQARIAPFPGAAQATICPRCLLEIALGQPAVICPACGVAYHEDGDAELLCWTYGPCSFCGQPGSLNAGLQWSPDEL
jgi:hypothetical protein